jgi:phosphoserine phosphatase
MLKDWPAASRDRLIERLGQVKSGDFAVFDADNTLWQHDVTESLLVWMERRGVREVSSLPPVLRPLDPDPHPTLWSYYRHLCHHSVDVGYLWVVQIFAGLRIAEQAELLDDMLSSDERLCTTELVGGALKEVEIERPRPFLAQIGLIEELKRRGVDVWVMSASPEDLVRTLLMHPHTGFGVDPDRVCGVNLVLQGEDPTLDCGAFCRARGVAGWRNPAWQHRTLSSTPVAPLTWYEGKVSGIRAWVNADRAPFLVAGDSSNDLPMQKGVDPRGVRVRVHPTGDGDEDFAQARGWQGAPWIEVQAEELSPRPVPQVSG